MENENENFDPTSLGIEQGYVTQDFYFTAFLLASDDISVVLIGLLPIKKHSLRGRRDAKGIRFEFILGIRNADNELTNAQDIINPLHNEFISGTTRVDPQAYNAVINSLRSKILTESKNLSARQKRFDESLRKVRNKNEYK